MEKLSNCNLKLTEKQKREPATRIAWAMGEIARLEGNVDDLIPYAMYMRTRRINQLKWTIRRQTRALLEFSPRYSDAALVELAARCGVTVKVKVWTNKAGCWRRFDWEVNGVTHMTMSGVTFRRCMEEIKHG